MPKSFIITIKNLEESKTVAQRGIESGKKFGLDIQNFWATTPHADPFSQAKAEGIDASRFVEKYSRLENALSAFLSHYWLWKKCALDDVPYLIMEHDAVVVDNIPNVEFEGLLSLGKPSYGRYNIPFLMGVNTLTSKTYLPGAHGYLLNRRGANAIVSAAKKHAKPTDVYLNKNDFPWIQEYYPWPIEAHDSFTTIQKVEGCLAKHNYSDDYKIL